VGQAIQAPGRPPAFYQAAGIGQPVWQNVIGQRVQLNSRQNQDK
jgi:hypothetical protein